MSPLLNDPGPGRKIASRYNLDGPSPITQISPEAVGVVLLDDLSGPASHDTLELRDAFGGTAQDGVANEFGHIQIFNPTNSGVDLIVDGALVSAATGGRTTVRAHDTAITTNLTTKGFRDSRVAGGPVGQVRRATDASVLGTQIAIFEIPAAESILLPLVLIVQPGTGYAIARHTVNTQLTVTYYWSERVRPRQ